MDFQTENRKIAPRFVFGAIDQVSTPPTGCVPNLDVRIGDKDRFSIPRAPKTSPTRLLISGAVLVALALASTWIIATVLDGHGYHQASQIAGKVTSPINESDLSKADRLETANLPNEYAPEIRHFEKTSSAFEHASKRPLSRFRQPKTASLPDADLAAPRPKQNDRALPKSAPKTEQKAIPISALPRVPVPETKPTTISGWVIREANGSSAVLEGPGGIRTVFPGETIPELGRIDSILRWGKRWIVATSSGLISTP